MPDLNNLSRRLSKNSKQRTQLSVLSTRLMTWSLIASLLIVGLVYILFQSFNAALVVALVSLIACILIYTFYIAKPFEEIKSNFKSVVLSEFMTMYHPEVEYEYQAVGTIGHEIITRSGLIECQTCQEEDVLIGDYKDTRFYISEIHLSQDSDDSTDPEFKGILFKIILLGRSYSRTRIQSTIGLLDRLWLGFKKNEKFGFFMESVDTEASESQLSHLFPFISHLMKRQGNVRVHIFREEIVLLMESDINFLDEPEQTLHKQIDLKKYNLNLGRQLNSLLYVVEALATNLNLSEMEERLELKAIEVVKRKQIS